MTFYKKFTLLLVIIFANKLTGQNGITNIPIQVGNGDYKDQQEVHLKTPAGQLTPSGIGQGHMFIDPSITIPTPYNISNSFGVPSINYVLDQSKVVGAIPYNYDISPMGSAVCDVPIDVPIGTNNIKPALSLNYNSLGSLGEMGTGWTIGGLQSISRLQQTLYHNNNITAVNLTNSDVFALNGNRLLPTVGVNGAANTIYKPEVNNFCRTTSMGSFGNGPDWFKVETKEGLTLEFGNSIDSKVIPVGQNTVFEWKLSKIYDPNGNYIVYEYNNNAGEALIKGIKYTGNAVAGIAPYNTINFYYNLIGEQNTSYVNGGALSQRSILRQIDIKQEGNIASRYNFVYTNYFNNSFLTDISLTGADYSSLNNLKLSYQNDLGNPTFQQTTGGLVNIWNRQYQTLDFTGDGLKDFVAFDGGIITGFYSPFLWQDWRILKNNGNSNFSQIGGNNTFPSGFAQTDIFPTSKNAIGSMNYLSYDFNGDNKEDLLFRGIIGSNDYFNIYISNGNGFNPPILLTIPIINSTPNSLTPNLFWVIDMNGDQKLDLLYQDNTSNYRVWLNVASGNQTPDHNITFANVLRNTRPIDIDGDGKTEILVENNPSNSFSKIILNSSNQLQMISLPFSNSFLFNQPNYIINNSGVYGANTTFLKLEGDYNGDGKTDYVFSTQIGSGPTPSAYKWELYFNKGDGTYTSPILLNKSGLGLQDHTTPVGSPKWFYYSSDMNGDGKTDLIEFKISNPVSTSFKVYYSMGVNGDYFFTETYPIPPQYNLFLKEMEFTDVDGNGVNDIVMYNQGSASDIPYIIYFYKGAISKNIKEIIDPYGKKVNFGFGPITNQSIYSQNQNKIYPLSNFSSPIYVVNSVSSSNGIGGTTTENYNYENAVLHKQGKGLIGFSKITKVNITTDTKQIDEYSYNVSQLNLVRNKTSFFNYSSNTLISDEVITNQNLSVSGLSYWPAVNNILKTNYLQNYTALIEYGYDSDGNTVLDRKKINNTLDVEETYFSSFISNGSWLPSKPNSVLKTVTRTGFIPYTQNFNYTYDNFGHILSETKEPSDAKMIVNGYTYDPATGVVISQNISAPNSALPVKSWQYSYDSKFRMATKETNALNQFIQYAYDFKWGKPTTVTDVEGLNTYFTYDGYGRVKSTKTPDNENETYSYSWVTPGDFNGGDPLSVSNCLYKITTAKIGHRSSTNFYDLFNRRLRTETDGLHNKLYQMVAFDNKGNVNVETGPYQLIIGNSYIPLLKTNSFDNLNRITQTSVTDGNNTKNTSYTYGYSGGDIIITTTEPDGKNIVRRSDASGLLKSVQDNGGTINYTYYSNRQPQTINVNGVQANYFEYDVHAMQTKLQDRDAGLTLYNYSAYGELLSKTDANNKTYNYVYDLFGRLTTKTGPDGAYSYQYVTSGSGLNKVLQETSPSGYFKKYSYDNISRSSKIEENVNGQSFSTEYFYDVYNRPEKTKYPSGFVTKNVFNLNGILFQIRNDQTNQIIWEDIENNPFGQPTKYLSGNGILTQCTFNNFAQPTQFNTPGVRLLNFNFSINNGNLNSRQDAVLGKTETFTYDNLDRLTQVQIPSLINFNITYNNKGNILTKSGLGNFTYKPNKPDAVNEVDNTNSIISLNQQDITYTSFNKVQNIIEDIYQYDVFYGPDDERKMSKLYANANLTRTRYYVGDYEKTIQGANTQEVHYINSPSGLVAIYVLNNNVPSTFYTYEDYLGTIMNVTDANGNIVVNLNYDAWGRRRNNSTWDYTNPTIPPVWLYRGYTGHEHLEEFELIDMNGRLYDPILGQMLSPDQYNQMPDYTQNYNRYSYAFNNPLKYKDPTGNVLGTILGFIRGVFNAVSSGGLEFWNANSSYVASAWSKADPTLKGTAGNNGFRIDLGLFKTDPNKSFLGRSWEIVSRFSYQLLQTAVGWVASSFGNFGGNVTEVNYYGGATAITHVKDFGGFTIGNFINGGPDLKADPNNELFQHEYGHYIQSQVSGPLYIWKYALPSLHSARHTDEYYRHSAFWTEQDANVRANKYFSKYVNNYSGWDYDLNPIFQSGRNGWFDTNYGKYKTNNGQVDPKWWEYFIGAFTYFLNLKKGQ